MVSKREPISVKYSIKYRSRGKLKESYERRIVKSKKLRKVVTKIKPKPLSFKTRVEKVSNILNKT